jgi:hypothetical protein
LIHQINVEKVCFHEYLPTHSQIAWVACFPSGRDMRTVLGAQSSTLFLIRNILYRFSLWLDNSIFTPPFVTGFAVPEICEARAGPDPVFLHGATRSDRAAPAVPPAASLTTPRLRRSVRGKENAEREVYPFSNVSGALHWRSSI